MISSLCIVCFRLIYYVVKTSVNMYDHLCVVKTQDYVLCICVVETCMWMWMNNRVLRLMCCVLKFKSGHVWVYDQLYVDKIVFCVLLWMRLVCGCEWTSVWLGFVYCELFRLQLPFPDQFRAILLGFIRFRYTGIYRPLSVSDFPVYRFRSNKKLCARK